MPRLGGAQPPGEPFRHVSGLATRTVTPHGQSAIAVARVSLSLPNGDARSISGCESRFGSGPARPQVAPYQSTTMSPMAHAAKLQTHGLVVALDKWYIVSELSRHPLLQPPRSTCSDIYSSPAHSCSAR